MIRGAIDLTTPDTIGGWIYSDAFGVRDLPVLAFLDEVCVGAGRVSEFRRDLADAGLGDGYLGFKFGISLQSPEEFRRVVVKLEGSDALLVQQGVRITAPDESAPPPRVATRRISCLFWMRDRGWLKQEEYDFLTLIDQAGVYDRILGGPSSGTSPATRRTPEEVAADLFSLYRMESVRVERQHVDAASDLPALLAARTPQDGSELIVALWTAGSARIAVAERSHLAPPAGGMPEPAAPQTVTYLLSADRLLLLNARCRIEARSIAPKEGIHVLLGQPAEEMP